MMGKLGDFMSKMADGIDKGSKGNFGKVAVKLITTLLTGLIKNAPKLAIGAIKLILSLTGYLMQAAPQMIKAGAQAIGQFVKGFLDGHPKIAKAVETIGKVFNVALAPVKAIIDGVTSAWKKLTGQKSSKKFSVSAPFSGALKSIKDVFGKWKDVLGQKAKKTYEVVKSGFSSVLDSMKSIYNKWKDILAQKATKHFSITSSGSVPKGGKRIGLREVPYDGYVTELHKGEAILTASEVNQYKKRMDSLNSVASGIVEGINTSNMMSAAGTTEAKIVINLGGAKVAEQVFRLNKQGKLAFTG